MVYNDLEQWNGLAEEMKRKLQVINHSVETVGDDLANNLSIQHLFRDYLIKKLTPHKLKGIHLDFQRYKQDTQQRPHLLYDTLLQQLHQQINQNEQLDSPTFNQMAQQVLFTLAQFHKCLDSLVFPAENN